MRRAAHKDANHDQIKATFLGLGCSWADTFRLGDGHPDGVAGINGVDQMVEIKAPDARSTKAPETWKAQQDFAERWRGRPIVTVRTVEDVQAVVRGMQALARGAA